MYCHGIKKKHIAIIGVLIFGFMGGATLFYVRSLQSAYLISGLSIGEFPVEIQDPSVLNNWLNKIAKQYEISKVVLRFGSRKLIVSCGDLGASLDILDTKQRLQNAGKSGYFFADLFVRIKSHFGGLEVLPAIEIDQTTTKTFLHKLKSHIDRSPKVASVDLENGQVLRGEPGYNLRFYDTLVAIEQGLILNNKIIDLIITKTEEPGASNDALRNLDISHVLGHFTTVYSLADKDKDRAHNLRLAASKLDGYILKPKEELSFNQQVGPRDYAQGYRTAKVITANELIDGMAGGSCQISSTLFAAAFFAGLDLVNSKPHTIPSSYVKMGLDATVAYPDVDLVIGNPYPFPVVICFKVNQGKVQVKIRGKARPWRQITFRREITEVTPFEIIERKDLSLPRSAKVIEQAGAPGFRLIRQRLFFGKGKEPDKIEERKLLYPPTPRIIRLGTGPKDPKWKPPEEPKPLGEVPKEFSITQ